MQLRKFNFSIIFLFNPECSAELALAPSIDVALCSPRVNTMDRMPEAHQRSGLISLVFFLLLSLLLCTPHFVNSEQLSTAEVPEYDLGARNVEDEELFLANDQLYIQFYAKSPSSKMMFNQTTYQADFYTNVMWSQLTEGENRQFPIPSDFSFVKSHIPNPSAAFIHPHNYFFIYSLH